MAHMKGYSSFFYKYVFNNFMFGEPPNGMYTGNRSRYIDVSSTEIDFDGSGLEVPTDPAYVAYYGLGLDIFNYTPKAAPSLGEDRSIVWNMPTLTWPVATQDWGIITSILVSHQFGNNPGYDNPVGIYPLLGGLLDGSAWVQTSDQLACLAGDFRFTYIW